MLKFLGLTLLLALTVLAASLPPSSDDKDLINGRIVGGSRVVITQHPHQISMRRKGNVINSFNHHCGGSIYKANVIITAAHCVVNYVAKNFIIVAGTENRNGNDGVVALVEKIITHENYNGNIYNNDVALLILSTPLPLNGVTIAPITLATNLPRDGAKATVTGWGTTTSGGRASDQLLGVEVPIVNNERCDAAYAVAYGPGQILESMLCAGVEGTGGKDACQGDSGGPLLVNRELAGIVSWGRSCALGGYPGVYASVPYLKAWIEKNLPTEVTL